MGSAQGEAQISTNTQPSAFEASVPRPPNLSNTSLPEVGAVDAAFLDVAPETFRAGTALVGVAPTSTPPDLGSLIKYCIIFPLLESAGPPMPDFNVPPCPAGPPGPGEPPRLTVVKDVVNDDEGIATTTDFTLLVGSTTVRSGVVRFFLPGTYRVSEATTTVTVGTTTMTYAADFSGDCDATGSVTLVLGDDKVCVVTNDDSGPGGQGGDGGDGGNGGDGGDGGGGDDGGGNP